MRLPLNLCCAALLAALGGCGGSRGTAVSDPDQQAVAHSSRIYSLGKTPDQEREEKFREMVAGAHDATAAKSASAAAGFSYSLAPRGAVYPFSEAEVECLIRKADSARGKKLCADFFKAIDAGFRAIQEK